MKIAVICSNGRVGRLVVKEATERGHDVTGIALGENLSGAAHYIEKDLFDLTKEDLEGYDAVVDAFGVWQEEEYYKHGTTLKHLSDILEGTSAHLYIVGGAGSLYVNKEHTVCLSDTEGFPAVFLPLAKAQAESLKALRTRTGFDWTYVSPAGDFQAEGERTGKYILGGEELTLNSKGESILSYADYAIGMVDLIEDGGHIHERVSLVRE